MNTLRRVARLTSFILMSLAGLVLMACWGDSGPGPTSPTGTTAPLEGTCWTLVSVTPETCQLGGVQTPTAAHASVSKTIRRGCPRGIATNVGAHTPKGLEPPSPSKAHA